MGSRLFSQLGTAAVYAKGETAARQHDAATFEECVRELRSRKRGEELIDELRELREQVARGRSVPPPSIADGLRASDVEALTVITDNECHRRFDMLRRATRSIWLSTFTIRDGKGELREILDDRTRKGVRATLIVSPGPIRPGGHAEEVIADLRSIGVRVIVTTNHSKCAIVDEEEVIVGSANIQDVIIHDVGLHFRSRSIARALIEYLGSLQE
jgi:phosphatidylserine/phosphatidylglycerophosphate/cardiolipin synthase-like enzyme